jgi:hypothetical protein
VVLASVLVLTLLCAAAAGAALYRPASGLFYQIMLTFWPG